MFGRKKNASNKASSKMEASAETTSSKAAKSSANAKTSAKGGCCGKKSSSAKACKLFLVSFLLFVFFSSPFKFRQKVVPFFWERNFQTDLFFCPEVSERN